MNLIKNSIKIAALLILFSSKLEATYQLIPKPPKDETIVCLHGFMRSKWCMMRITHFMENEGFRVYNHDYPTREKPIEAHGKDLIQELKALAIDYPGRPIHFITHSMGALVLRSAVNDNECPEEAKMGKAVLLAPPNQGSAFGRSLKDYDAVRWVVGPAAGAQLLESEGFDTLGEFPPSMDVMVIAGEFDSRVSLEEAKLKGPHTFLVLPRGHSLIMYDRKAIREANNFLSR